MSRDPEEEWSSEYDSTWEEEGEEKPRGKREPGSRSQPNYRKSWNRAARDLQNYRRDYRDDKNYQAYSCQNAHLKPNLDFYQNKKRFEPNGLLIDEVLDKWKDDYFTLERNHSYIQWLFPLREYGMNSCAKPLTKTEIEAMRKDENVQKKFLAAYRLMLNFYGIRLEDEESGKLSRAENWEERFKNLNYHSHNNLRITRILKCLGELGFGHFQAPLVRFFLEETLRNGKLQNVKRSALDYFMFTVKDKMERRKLVHFAWENYKPKDGFIWGPVEKLRTYPSPAEHEHLTEVGADEAERNGLLQSCSGLNEEEDCSDSETPGPNASAKSCEANQECIRLRMTVKDKENRKCTSSLSQDNDPVSNNLSNGLHEMQLCAENKGVEVGEVKSQVTHNVSSEHGSEVPSTEGSGEDQTIDGTNEVISGTDSKDQNESSARKRKLPNSPNNDLSDSTAHTIQSKANSDLSQEEEEGSPMECDSANKKPKLHKEPYPENSLNTADDQQLPSEEQSDRPKTDSAEGQSTAE